MQTTHQVDIIARSVPDWQTSDEEESHQRPGKSKHRKKPRVKSRSASQPDRPLSFAQAVCKRIDGRHFRCQEYYPQEGPESVLYVVLEREAAQWRDRLHTLHRDFFGPEHAGQIGPVRLEVIDRATHDAVERLISAGLLARTTRFTRSLWPVDETTSSAQPMSEAEREKAEGYRRQAERKLKVASVLAAGDLEEEAREALLQAIEPLGRALAVENRLPEPESLEDALLPPIGPAWRQALPLVRRFLREPSQPVGPLLDVMGQV
jgi:hypothetical protein